MEIVTHIYLFFVSLSVVQTRAEVKPYVSSFIKLLELQMEYCSGLSLCTVQTSMEQPPAVCCTSCSCDVDCQELANCCPDFQFVSLIGDNVTSNISVLSEQLQNLNLTYNKRLQEIWNKLQGEPRDIKENMKCVNAKAIKSDIRLEIEVSHSYLMITTCPTAFQRSVSSVKSQCEDEISVEPFARNRLHPDLVVPVTSLKTNITYKNVYCFRCNEDNHLDMGQWKVIITCSMIYPYIAYDNPYTFFQRITSSDTYYGCNLLYHPNETTERFVNRCSASEVKTCPDNTDTELDNTCKAFDLPVIDYYKTFTVYKNIACYICNNKKTSRADCRYSIPQNKEFSMELNFLHNDQNTFLEYTPPQLQELNISFAKDERNNCNTGFILHQETDSCRRVLCPRYFYPVRGSCIPEFTKITNVSFTVMFMVVRVQTLVKADNDIFYQKYMNSLERILATLSGQFTYGQWQFTVDIDVLVLSFIAENSTYVGMLNTLSTFMTKIAVLQIKTKTTLVKTLTVPFKNTTHPLFLSGKLYKDGRKKIQLSAVRAYRALPNSPMEIRIGNPHLCYRTEIGPSEFYNNQKRTLYYVNNNETILNINDIQTTEDETIIVCLDDFFKTFTDVKTGYMFGGYSASFRSEIVKIKRDSQQIAGYIKPDKETIYETITKLPKELVMTIVFVAVIGAIGLAKFLKYRKENNAQRERQAGQHAYSLEIEANTST